ncbi:hypothetical protein [Haloarchaeobius iranensis]|uniref:Uncharacterized protein n=1 Tax=Haloarchaeobius iranensis TaxID=996166 RepID=A0A1G9V0P5_9EURY|nr:hypothetical protein [Haloarchaeobius iranensis]SDM65708.1 hypothetical protein SAMN05192554_105119 [Haloarchaeobius iranensis]
MARSKQSLTTRIGRVLLGSITVLVTAPTGLGASLGGWLAGRGTDGPLRGAVAGGAAGLLGSLPWVALVYFASAGAFAPVGYHENGVHIGINTMAPGALTLWQELGIAALMGGIFVGFAVVGGLVAGLSTTVLAELRADGSAAS